MRIYKPVILNKLSLSKKFSRQVLYARKSVLGVGLMKLFTIIMIIALKLYISYKKLQTSVVKIIFLMNALHSSNMDIVVTQLKQIEKLNQI